MPIKKSAAKTLRQSEKKSIRNKKIKSDIAALVRKIRKSVASNDGAKAQDWFKQAVKKIDKAVQKGIIKKNTANRSKSRLAKAINVLKTKKGSTDKK